MGCVGQLVGGPFVEGGLGRRAEHALVLWIVHGGGLRGIGRKRFPAEPVRPVEAERFAQVVDGRLLLVGDVLVFRYPEEVGCHYPRERGAILVLGDLGKLVAKRPEGRVVDRGRQRDRHGLVWSEHRRRRLRRWVCRLQRLGHDGHGRERAREREGDREDVRGRQAWTPHRDFSQVPSATLALDLARSTARKKGFRTEAASAKGGTAQVRAMLRNRGAAGCRNASV